MSEEQRLEIRFEGESLGSYTDNRGVTYRLFKRSGEDYDYYFIHHDDPEGPAWLEDGRSNGLSEGEVRMMWPELTRFWTSENRPGPGFGRRGFRTPAL